MNATTLPTADIAAIMAEAAGMYVSQAGHAVRGAG